MTQQQKPHRSASQLESYCRCPEAYRRRYLDKDIIPPGIAMLKGTGLHGGAERNFRQKIETREDLPVSEIVEAAVAKFEGELTKGVTLTDDEESAGPQKTIGSAKDDLVAIAQLHAEKQAPEYQPIMVEKLVRIELASSPCDLLGIIDLADERGIVVDLKTAGRRKSQGDADDSVQLTIYASAYHAVMSRPPAEVRLDSLIKTKTKADRQVLSSHRGEADFIALANRINAVNKGIDAGSFPPATPGAWWCGPRFCGYWQTCAYVNSERKAKAEDAE